MSEVSEKILVMDDEEIVADIAKQMLVYLGYAVINVENGEEAVQAYQKAHDQGEPYDLVIMDLNIPNGMGGMEAVKQVLDIDNNARVLVSTGYSSDSIMSDYGSHGFSGCIAKPFDLKGLQEAVQAALK